MPEFLFDTDSVIPEELRTEAKKNDAGKFVLNLVPKSKLDEFRENNINVAKERDNFKAFAERAKTIVGEDIDAFSTNYAELQKIKQQVADGTIKASGEINKEIEQRTEAMRQGFEKKSREDAEAQAKLVNQINSLKNDLNKVHVDRAVTAAVMNEKSGAIPEALPHIMAEAYKVFSADGETGEVTPKNGDTIIYGSSGTVPMTPLEWLEKLREKAPYLFKNSSGGGAAGGADKARLGGMTQEQFNKLSPAQKLALANTKKK